MRRIRGHLVSEAVLEVGPESLTILVPARGEALLDDPAVVARFEQDEYMPYWAQIWPAARLLADAVAEWPRAERNHPARVLELGAGLGVVGLVAALRGYDVTLTDHDEDALAFARASARRNHLPPLRTRVLDWRNPPLDERLARILAADVLYEGRNLEPIAACIHQQLAHDGFALVCDPYRRTADPFPDTVRRVGLSVTERAVSVPDPERAKPIAGRIFELRHA